MLCAFTIHSIRFGLGSPDDQTTIALQIRAVTYAEWGEICYLITIGLTKTSIGIAVLRLARRQSIRWVVVAIIVISNVMYLAAMVMGLVGCKFLWDQRLMAGCTKVPVLRKIPLLPSACLLLRDGGHQSLASVMIVDLVSFACYGGLDSHRRCVRNHSSHTSERAADACEA